MVTNAEINEYIYCIRTAFVAYGDGLTKAFKLGKPVTYLDKLRFSLASYYIDIMLDYFDNESVWDFQFFTVEEINDIMQHINNLLGSNCWIDLTDTTVAPREKVYISWSMLPEGRLYADFSFDGDWNMVSIQWYRMDDLNGANTEAVSGANSRVYELTHADIGKYIYYIVTT